MTLASGTRLGPYEILAPIGAGGMGEVYRARDTRLDRTVAIKVLPERLSSSPEVRQRFEREAKTISALSHPHICALHDVGNQDGVEYLVMEYLEGEALADRLVKGPLPLEQTLRYGIQIADALDRAHRQGIVHRDLKPGNVMLTKSGVKLLDFGLAKAIAAPPQQSGLTSFPTVAGSPNLTQEGTILGTFQYMAPEQLEGREADARTDIFAFGATLYEMATGRKAFSGSSQASLISAIMKEEPASITAIQPINPPALEHVVRRCLAKDPERRWQSARDVALELEEIAKGGQTPETIRRPARGVVGWVVAAALILLVAGILLSRARQQGQPVQKVQFAIAPPAGSALNGMLALSPDGRTLAFVATGPDGRDRLFVRPLDALDARPLEGSEGAAFPFWSPDSRNLAFFAQGKLKRIEATGGAPQTLCDARQPRGGSWGSAGTMVFSANSGGEIQRVSENGGQATSLSHLTARQGQTNRWPSFLPDGRHFLYYSIPDPSGIFVASLDSKEKTHLTSADGGAIYTPPGYLLYRSGDRLVGQPFDAVRRLLGGEAFPVIEHIWWNGIATTATAVSASDTGLLACQTGGATATRLLLYDRSGRELAPIGPAGGYWEPTLSPDARWLAVPRMDPDVLGANIWMIDLERGSFIRISSQAPIPATPLWSSDGDRIVYCAFPSGEVFIRDAGSAEDERILFRAPSFTPLDDWSRDGRFLFYEFIEWRTSHTDVWVRDMKSGQSRPILQAKFNQTGARLSPDGAWLAYESDESGTSEIFVRSFPESRERRQVSTGGGNQARWRGDGRELFFISPDRKVMAVDVRTEPRFETGVPHALFQTRILPLIEARNHYDAAADGQRFVVNSRRPEEAALPITVVVGWLPEKGK